ncbi:MAG: autotransporter-associated beta strand repeat-containing protein [Gemmataceae bacterium]
MDADDKTIDPLGKELASQEIIMLTNWFQRLREKSIGNRRSCRKARSRVRLEVEQLENRLAPATWTGAVDTLWSHDGNWTNGLPTSANAQLIFPANGVFNFTSQNDLSNLNISSIRIEGNTGYTISGNSITLGTGGFTVLNSTAAHAVSLPIALSGLGVGFGIASGARVDLNGVISGGGGTTLNKNDQGTLRLTTANPDLLGSINVNTGTLQVTNAQALGPANNGGETTVSNDATATLQLSAGADHGTENVHLGGRILVDSTLNWDGFVDLNGSPRTIEVTVGNTFTLTGAGPTGLCLTGTGSLLKAGAGTLVLAAHSSFGGADVAAGVLNVRAASSTGSTKVESGAALEVQDNITLTTSGLTLNGTGTTGNGALLNVSGTNTVTGAVTLASASTIGSTAGTVTVNENINNAGFLLTVNGAGNTIFDSTGVLSGTGGLTKNGAGTLTMSGTGVNTYSGATTINQGAVNIRKASALGATTAGTTVTATGAALQVQGGVTFNAEPLTLIGTGITATGALRNVSGNNIWLGNITVGSASTIGSSANTLTVNGNIDNHGFLLTVNGAGSTVFDSAGVLSGAGGLTKSGTGTLTLSGTGVNTYGGATTVSQGALNIQKASALGATTAGTTVATGAALQAQGGVTFDAEPLTINGTGVSGGGALANVSGNNTWQGNIAVGAQSRIVVTAGALTVTGNIDVGNRLTVSTGGGDATVSGVISGASGIDKDGPNTLTLAGTLANTFAGAARLANGTLVFNKSAGVNVIVNAIGGNLDIGIVVPATLRLLADNQIPDTATVNTLPGGIFDLNGHNETIGPLNMTGGRITTGTGLLTLNSTVTATSASNGGAATATVTATIEGNLSLVRATPTFTVNDGPENIDLNVAAVVSGDAGVGLTKAGAGKMVLGGNNTYPGATTVNAGTLAINGNQGADPTVVNTGGTLAGDGTVGPLTVNGGGIVRPGAGLSLSVNGNATFTNDHATYSADLIATSVGTLGATRTLALNNALSLFDINDPTHPELLPPLNDPLPILGAAAITGTFNGLPNNAIAVSSSGLSYRVNYTPTIVFVTRISGPAFQNRAITSPINEGSVATLTGHITTILPTDTFFLEVNWGDGGKTKTYKFKPDDPRDVALEHRYLDDGVYSVGLLWRDQRGSFNTDTLAVTVLNVAPQVDAGTVEILKSAMLTRLVTFTDPGKDHWTATVDYGDGSAPVAIDVHGGQQFLLRHRYTVPGTYTVAVTVDDGDGGIGAASFQVEVVSSAHSDVIDAVFRELSGQDSDTDASAAA